MTIPTLAKALAAADAAVTARYGQSHAGITRAAVEAVLALTEPSGTVSEPKQASGWSGIRGEPEIVITDVRQNPALAKTILASFKEGKDGHWRAHVGSGEYQGWLEAAGGPESAVG